LIYPHLSLSLTNFVDRAIGAVDRWLPKIFCSP
jgi:hypothetical protein